MKKIRLLSSLKDLKRLMVGKNSIRTSDGNMYGGKNDVWARDRAITGEDLINIKPEITEKTILDLAKLQGVASHYNSGEEPGRIHTEHREIYNNKKLGLFTKLLLSLISGLMWKTGWKKYTIYFSSDTTPLFIRTTCAYLKKYPEILDKIVKKKDGSFDTILESVLKAARYIESTIDSDGLIRIREHNLIGNQFRYWRDSPNSYRDELSKLPNISEAMVILDVQYLSAEALDSAANLTTGEEAKKWHTLAGFVRSATINYLWMEDKQYFAYGMDQDNNDSLRQIKTIQSNAGWLLNSEFFDYMLIKEKEKYITGIITRIFSDELLTDAGIRCRSKKYMNDRNFHTYHGSWVSWPVDSYMIAKGLRRQGFNNLADQLESRLINTVNMSGVNYEFFIVDEEGKVLLNPNKRKTKNAKVLPIEMKPEKTIAWTVTATLRAKKERASRLRAEGNPDYVKIEQEIWVHKLEKEVLAKIKKINLYETEEQVQRNQYQEPNLYIDRKTGLHRAFIDLFKTISQRLVNEKIKSFFTKRK